MKDIIVWTVAVIAVLIGFALMLYGVMTPPLGVIDGSILVGLGEVLTFFGSVAGIGEYTKIQIKKIEKTKD